MKRLIKRLLDIGLAAGLLIFSSPLFILAALLIRFRLGAPVLFRQQRPGFKEKPFLLYKFRTMREAFDAAGRALPDDQRMTPLGRWLRRLSIDELPQLINVLRGEMSVVGPRPLLMQYLPLYNPRQRKRHDVPPGITGWAQVNGRNAISWEEKFELDVRYVENWSLALDAKILLRTALKVFRREGISAGGYATMPFFTGSPADPGKDS